MRRRCFPIVFLIFQLLVSNKSFGHAAEEIEYDYINPVARHGRSIRFDQPLRENSKREVLDRLISYFRWPASSFSEFLNQVVLAEGVGEVFVRGDDICTDGVTEIEGSVPISGSVTFSGPVRASGTVTIAGRCAPASGGSSLRLGQQLLPVSSKLPAVMPAVPEVSPAPEYIPTPCYDVLPLITEATQPTISLAPVVIPAIVIPAYVFPEVVIPAEVYELGTGSGNVVVTGDDVIVNGATYIDGSVPTLGEVSFGGYVPAKGTVTIYSCF